VRREKKREEVERGENRGEEKGRKENRTQEKRRRNKSSFLSPKYNHDLPGCRSSH
jgi:hypothetical protein